VSTDQSTPWPLQLRVKKQARILSVEFDDGQSFDVSFELLRVESPSAQVQGHRPSEKKIVPDKANVSLERIEPVGRYGVRLVFDDGHDSGIYTWGWLYQLGRDGQAMLAAYHGALSRLKPQSY
jgi:DUF971 family protein